MESSESKVTRWKKQAGVIAVFLDKASTYDMSTDEIVEAILGLTCWCIIERARPGDEDVTEALYIKQLKDIFAKAKESKRAQS